MSVMHVTATAGPGSRAAKPQQILDAARALFLKDGFSATSMDAVAKAAGVSKATVYAHYKSKEELFAAMIGAECGRTWPELAARYHGEAEAGEGDAAEQGKTQDLLHCRLRAPGLPG